MKTIRNILFILAAITALSITVSSTKNEQHVGVETGTCYYMLFPQSVPASVIKYSDASINNMVFRILKKDKDGNVIQNTSPVFNNIIRDNDGFAGRFDFFLMGDKSEYNYVYIRFNSDFKYKFRYPINTDFCTIFSERQLSYVKNWIYCGVIDSTGNYIFKPEYDDIIHDDSDDTQITAIKQIDENNDSELKITRYDCDKRIYESYQLVLPSVCIPYVSSRLNLRQFYTNEFDDDVLLGISDSIRDSLKLKEMLLFHKGISKMITQNVVEAQEIFEKLSASNDGDISSLAKINLQSISLYAKNSKIGFHVISSISQDEPEDRHMSSVQFGGELYITDNASLAKRNKLFITDIKKGKRIVLKDRKGNMLKYSMPIFDDIRVEKSNIICYQKLTIYNGYDIQMKLIFDNDLNLIDAEVIPMPPATPTEGVAHGVSEVL